MQIQSMAELLSALREHHSLAGMIVHQLDLMDFTDALMDSDMNDSVFLGCQLHPEAVAHITRAGGLVFPHLGDLPFKPYRCALYTPMELMRGYQAGSDRSALESTLDGRIYQHYDDLRRRPGPIPLREAIARRLHDHGMDRALQELLTRGDEPKRVVGIMGGHAMVRTDPHYAHIARIAQDLTRLGYLVATGGGPGAMEAANLGAWMAGHPTSALDDAVQILARAPDWRQDAWFDTALQVREEFPEGRDSLGIPTWFYGHEPSNLFARHIAKYFANSLREDGLLAVSLHGILYAPGSAGTVQEVFQDAAQNHYGTFKLVSPMVLLGTEHWNQDTPAFPLLRAQARGRQYEHMLLCTDDASQAIDFILSHPPVPYKA